MTSTQSETMAAAAITEERLISQHVRYREVGKEDRKGDTNWEGTADGQLHTITFYPSVVMTTPSLIIGAG